MFAGVHPEIYEQGAGGEKNLAASGQPRPKYRTAPVDSETVFRLPKVVACATREKAFFPVRAPSQKSYAPPLLFFRIRGRTFLTPRRRVLFFTNGTRRISLKRIGKSTIPRFNKHSFLSFSNFLVELIKAFAPIFLSLSLPFRFFKFSRIFISRLIIYFSTRSWEIVELKNGACTIDRIIGKRELATTRHGTKPARRLHVAQVAYHFVPRPRGFQQFHPVLFHARGRNDAPPRNPRNP